MAGAHRVSASCAQDGTVPAARQFKLESVKENFYFGCVVRCGKHLPSSRHQLAKSTYLGRRHRLAFAHFASDRARMPPHSASSGRPPGNLKMPKIDRDGINIY
ncbi:MAG TPA: hypothetical protein VGD75_12235, partial [Bradyrhizobium sp.]